MECDRSQMKNRINLYKNGIFWIVKKKKQRNKRKEKSTGFYPRLKIKIKR